MILIKAKLTEKRPIDVVRDAWREITRGAYRAVGMYWVETFLPEHFKVGAQQKYRYKPRTLAYLLYKKGLLNDPRVGRAAKKDRFRIASGIDEPLVLTGYMKRELMHNVIVRGFPSRATVIMLGPAYLSTNYKAERNQPDKPKEITTVTTEERKQLGKVLEQEVLKRINDYRGQRVTE